MTKRTILVNVKLNPAEYEALKTLAEREYRSLSAMIRVALLAYAQRANITIDSTIAHDDTREVTNDPRA